MVFGRCNAFATITVVFVSVVDWQNGYGGELGIRREKAPGMEHGADWNVTELGGSIVVANDPVG